MADNLLPAFVAAAVAARQLTPAAGYLWCWLRRLAGPPVTPGEFDPPACAPSDAELQRALGGYSRSQVARWLAELIAAGLVQRVTHAGQRWLQLCIPADVSPAVQALDVSPVAHEEVSLVVQALDVSPVTPPTGLAPGGKSAPVDGAGPPGTPPLSPAADNSVTADAPAVTFVCPAVDYTRLTDVQPAADPQPETARELWARLLAQLPPGVFAGTVGRELARSSAGLPVLIVSVPDAERARALDAGQAETVLTAALRVTGWPVRAVRFVYSSLL